MDNKRYFVDFGPELLQLLGPNLYTNIYYVLGEIIANAYDYRLLGKQAVAVG